MPYHLDTNARGGEILLYFRINISAKLLKIENLHSEIEDIFTEMHIKLLLTCTYNPNKSYRENIRSN